jgi:hypothetical protein
MSTIMITIGITILDVFILVVYQKEAYLKVWQNSGWESR